MPPKKRALAKAKPVKKTAGRGRQPVKEEEPSEDEESESESGSGSESDSDSEVDKKRGKKDTSGKAKSTKDQKKDKQADVRNHDKTTMAFQKGSYLIRLEDLDDTASKHIWKVDNHQLLQKYLFDEEAENDGPRQWYNKSNRYTGWFCDQGWKFIEPKVVTRDKDDKVQILYPSEESLQTAKVKCAEEDDRRAVDEDD